MDVLSSLIIVLGLISHIVEVCGIGPPDFISSWYTITAYSATSNITIQHDLESIPILVDVQIKVQDATHGDMIFSGIGSAQKGNENNTPFGGVLYIYNADEVKIISPGPSSCTGNCPGFLVYTGGSGYSGPTVTGQYLTAQVRVRLWSMCNFIRPSFISPQLPMPYYGNYRRVVYHKLGKTPDLVIVQATLPNGYVMDGHGSAFYTSTTTTFGGVIFGYDRTYVKVWIPKRGSGSSPSNGVPFAAMNGWGISGDFGYFSSANIRIWAWSFSILQHNPKVSETKTWKGHSSAEDIETAPLTAFDLDNSIVKVEVIPDDDSGYNNGFVFYGGGSTMTNGVVVAPNEYYGTLLYGVKYLNSGTSTLMMWRPSDIVTGCMNVVDGLWGNGYSPQCAKIAIVAVKLFKTSHSTEEPACGVQGCSITAQGPTCNCTGTGKEGQFCQSNIMCIAPIDHVNSNITNPVDSYLFNRSAFFSCNVGYIYESGSSSRTCQEDKTWTGEPFTCQPIPCSDPLSVANAAMNVSGRTSHVYQDETYYMCDEGYSLKTGNLTLICGANGTWDGTLPICDTSCGDPIAPTADRTNWGNTIGVTATFVCKDGYEFQSGNYTRTCQNDGTWDNSPLVCKRKDCGAPDNGANSGLTYSSTLFEDIAVYTCDVGYHSSGVTTKNSTCQADQTWSLTKLDCTKVLCSMPTLGNNTQLSGQEGLFYQDRIFLSCQFGYKLFSGDLIRQCQSDAQWSGQPPVCEVIICDMLDTNITNGNMTVTGTTFASIAVVVCDTNHAIKTGSPVRMCDQAGTWTGTAPECKAVQMVFLDDLQNQGNIISQDPVRLDKDDLSALKVHRKSTSNYKRTLLSIWDGRISAIAMGSVGTTVLIGVIAFICCLDCFDIVQHADKDRNTKKENLSIDEMQHEYANENIT